MKVKKHVELEEQHLDAINQALPGIALSHILNELLFHLSIQLLDSPIELAPYYRTAAQDAKDELLT